MSNKKKIIIICSMVVLLVAAAYLNVLLNKVGDDTTDGDDTTTTASFFTTYRTDRTTTRAQEIDYLDAIIASDTSSAEAIASAETLRLELIQMTESELVIEGLIKARGFDDAIVTMSTDNINVVIKDSELTSAEVAQILSIIVEQTGASASEVVIVPYSEE